MSGPGSQGPAALEKPLHRDQAEHSHRLAPGTPPGLDSQVRHAVSAQVHEPCARTLRHAPALRLGRGSTSGGTPERSTSTRRTESSWLRPNRSNVCNHDDSASAGTIWTTVATPSASPRQAVLRELPGGASKKPTPRAQVTRTPPRHRTRRPATLSGLPKHPWESP
jgi:hypothetical protein